MTFRGVSNPEEAATTGKFSASSTWSYIIVRGIPIGGYVRFSDDLEAYLGRHFPDFRLGEDLKVYHPVILDGRLVTSIRKIELYCIGWADMEKKDKAFPR